MADSIVTPEELMNKLLAGKEVDLLREAALSLLRELDGDRGEEQDRRWAW